MALENVTVSMVLELAVEIGIQQSVQVALSSIVTPEFLRLHADVCAELICPVAAGEAASKLEDALAPQDPERMQLLAVFLAAACTTRENYRSAGISEKLFVHTMGCFPRFLAEEYERTGIFAFTRGFWAWRQLSCLLFRLGTLEFEYAVMPESKVLPKGIAVGQPVIFVHIPSDANLSDALLQESYAWQKVFFSGEGAGVCSEGAPLAVLCNTWLLSPSLHALLNEKSGIRRFAADYEIYATDLENTSFYTWMFEGKKPPQALPQNTSLQRTVYAYLQDGGKIGSGCGRAVL